MAQLLTLSRLGDEETLMDTKELDLHKLVTEMMAYLAPHALEKDIEIVRDRYAIPHIFFHVAQWQLSVVIGQWTF